MAGDMSDTPSSVMELQQAPATTQVTMTLPEFRRAVLANLAQATDAKTEGNTLFAAGELHAAEGKYVAALELVGAALSVPALSARPDMGDLLTRAHSLHAKCHLNLAAVAHKRGEFETAGDFCREALRVEPRNVKAHFRLANALVAQGSDEEAAGVAERAARLDNGRTPEVGALAKRLKGEVAARQRRERAAFGGLFESKRYAQACETAREHDEEAERSHRLRVAHALRRHVPGDDGETAGALSAWIHGGAGAVAVPDGGGADAPSPRRLLMRLVRTAAADGALEDGELRDTLRAHGLGPGLLAAGDAQAEGLSCEESRRAQDTAQLSRVRAIMDLVKDRQALSGEQQRVLDDFRGSEIQRLEDKQREQPLSQEEGALLLKLMQQRDAVAQQGAELRARVDAAAEALRKMDVGVHIPIRERYNMVKALEGELGRLKALDESAGLTSEEAASLRQLTAYMAQRSSRAKLREQQQDALRLLSEQEVA